MSPTPLPSPKTLWLVELGETDLTDLVEALAARRRGEGAACVVFHGGALDSRLPVAGPAVLPVDRSEQVLPIAEMARLCNEGGAWAVVSVQPCEPARLQQVRAIIGVEHCRVVHLCGFAPCQTPARASHVGAYRPAQAARGDLASNAYRNETAGADAVVDATGMGLDEVADALWRTCGLPDEPMLTCPHLTSGAGTSDAGAWVQATSSPSDLPYGQSLEPWLQRAIERGDYAAGDIAAAMVEDGYPEAQAHVLAAAALVRYGKTPLKQLFTEPAERLDGHHLRHHLGRYLFGSAQADDQPRPWDPTLQLANRIVLRDCTVSLLAVAEHPRLALFSGLLSAEECEALIQAARQKLQPDAVVLLESGEAAVDSEFRSSMGCGFQSGEFEWLARIEARVSELLQWPLDRFEQTAISCYQQGAHFGFHHDYFRKPPAPPDAGVGPAGDRVATLVVYLSDVLEEGATAFSHLGLQVRPQRGHAVFFSYLCPDGTPDPASQHSGMPVTTGEKWIATFWLRAHSFRDHADTKASATTLAVQDSH